MLTLVPAAEAVELTFNRPAVLAVLVKLPDELTFRSEPVVKASAAVLVMVSNAPVVIADVVWLMLTPLPVVIALLVTLTVLPAVVLTPVTDNVLPEPVVLAPVIATTLPV